MKLSQPLNCYVCYNTVLSVTRKGFDLFQEEEKVSDMGIVFPYDGLTCGSCVGVCRLRMDTPTFRYHCSASQLLRLSNISTVMSAVL
jgi:hypothetical protein